MKFEDLEKLAPEFYLDFMTMCASSKYRLHPYGAPAIYLVEAMLQEMKAKYQENLAPFAAMPSDPRKVN